MSKLAVLFAGQGAQKTGMGKSLYENDAAAKQVFDKAEAIMPGIKELCFSGEQQELNKTVNTQPCVFTVDMAAWAALQAAGIRPQAGVGFSLGEYAALCAAGVLSFEDALKLVIKRAQWMQQAAEEQQGGMAAVLGKTAQEVEEIVDRVRGEGVLIPVNYNCPGQVVVAGDRAELDNLVAYAKENKIKCMPLPVNGAFHTERMQGVAQQILDYIGGMDFKEPAFTLYANRTAKPYGQDGFKQVMAEQTANPVLFEQIARSLLEDGYDTFVEVGPGNTLTGFMKRIDKELGLYNVNDLDSLLAVKEALAK